MEFNAGNCAFLSIWQFGEVELQGTMANFYVVATLACLLLARLLGWLIA
jgi:hypothetical protein